MTLDDEQLSKMCKTEGSIYVLSFLAADGDAPGVRAPADEHDGGDGGGHHQRRALPRQVGHARLHREGQGRGLCRRRRAQVSFLFLFAEWLQ